MRSTGTAVQTLELDFIMRPYLDRSAIVYLDDVLIFSKTLKNYVKHLEMVLQNPKDSELYAQPEWCSIGLETMESYGHELRVGNVKPSSRNTGVIRDWRVLKTNI